MSHTKTAYTIPTSTPEQRRYRAVSLSREYVDAELDRIAATLQPEQAQSRAAIAQRSPRQAEQDAHRNSLEHIFNPQPTKEEVSKMLEQISEYLMQEGALLDTYREHAVEGK